MFKPFKKRIQNGVYGPTSKKWKFHVCLSTLLLGFVPLMLLLAKTNLFETCCCGIFQAWLTNIEPTKELSMELSGINWIADVHHKSSHNKTKKGKIMFSFKFFLKPCRNLLFLGPTKGGPHKSIFPPRFPFYSRVRQLKATVVWYLINMELVCTTNVVASS